MKNISYMFWELESILNNSDKEVYVTDKTITNSIFYKNYSGDGDLFIDQQTQDCINKFKERYPDPNNNIFNPKAKTYMLALKIMSHIDQRGASYIKISNIDEVKVEDFTTIITKFKSLESLNMRFANIGDDVGVLAECLSLMKNLHFLNLSSNNLDMQNIKGLINNFSYTKNIEYLDISDNDFSDNSLDLIRGLKSLNLRSINLSNCDLFPIPKENKIYIIIKKIADKLYSSNLLKEIVGLVDESALEFIGLGLNNISFANKKKIKEAVNEKNQYYVESKNEMTVSLDSILPAEMIDIIGGYLNNQIELEL